MTTTTQNPQTDIGPAQKLRRLELQPATMFDIGVGPGTPYVYEAFPDAYHVLCEPLTEFEPALKSILERVRGEYHLTAIGRDESSRIINIEPDKPVRSSLLHRSALTAGAGPLRQRKVSITRLDSLVEKHGYEAPFGLKIDTEGYELDVLAGAEATLARTVLVVAEISIAERFLGSYGFAEFIARMDELGFRLVNFLELVGRNRGELLYADGVFIRKA